MLNVPVYLVSLRNPLIPGEGGRGYLSASCSLQRNKWRRHDDDDDGAGNTCFVPGPCTVNCQASITIANSWSYTCRWQLQWSGVNDMWRLHAWYNSRYTQAVTQMGREVMEGCVHPKASNVRYSRKSTNGSLPIPLHSSHFDFTAIYKRMQTLRYCINDPDWDWLKKQCHWSRTIPHSEPERHVNPKMQLRKRIDPSLKT